MVGNDSRRHHYVPRLLLKNFATERKPGKFQTTVFDKKTSKIFVTAIENVAVEHDFYALDNSDGGRFSMESGLGFIETGAAEYIAQIAAGKSLSEFSEEAKGWLVLFAALQFIRDRAMREQFLQLSIAVRERLISMVGEQNLPKGAEEIPDEDELKKFFFATAGESFGEIADHFNRKLMIVYRAPDAHPFLLGDSPVTMHNDKQFGAFGNIGLAVTGIQIHLPISPLYTLAFICFSHIEEMESAIQKGREATNRLAAEALLGVGANAVEARQRRAEGLAAIDRLKKHRDKYQSGTPILMEPTNVDLLNSLQIAQSERQIYCIGDHFDLARRMIADNERFRSGGKRMRVG